MKWLFRCPRQTSNLVGAVHNICPESVDLGKSLPFHQYIHGKTFVTNKSNSYHRTGTYTHKTCTAEAFFSDAQINALATQNKCTLTFATQNARAAKATELQL